MTDAVSLPKQTPGHGEIAARVAEVLHTTPGVQALLPSPRAVLRGLAVRMTGGPDRVEVDVRIRDGRARVSADVVVEPGRPGVAVLAAAQSRVEAELVGSGLRAEVDLCLAPRNV
ncbi:hypothetical protein ACF3NT_06940 [Naumannella halotolerans]|uniref:Uncharacterized protein n=1 Tax=Naumannella halotolerans TaxID=993414 RepID=A0A4R7J8F6_9ACTN|nr:hypothetical protein [Naumannella halotolerans]TDT33770.1 hypothetical protein CLV29_1400 [Naumannella halotolerans]